MTHVYMKLFSSKVQEPEASSEWRQQCPSWADTEEGRLSSSVVPLHPASLWVWSSGWEEASSESCLLAFARCLLSSNSPEPALDPLTSHILLVTTCPPHLTLPGPSTLWELSPDSPSPINTWLPTSPSCLSLSSHLDTAIPATIPEDLSVPIKTKQW